MLAVSTDILGEQTYRAKNGTVNVNQTRGIGINQASVIEFRYQRTDGKQLRAHLNFTTRECVPGEVESDTDCTPCPVDRYSFNTSSMCLDCEDHAQCPGGSVLVPEDGYWHSTPFSPRFRQCIIEEACVYRYRSDTLSKYYENVTLVLEDLEKVDRYVKERREDRKTPRPAFDSYNQCAEGYKSILCGSCEDGYGRLEGGKCQKCPSQWQLGLIPASLSLVMSIVLIGVQIKTLSFSLSENASVVSAMTKKKAVDKGQGRETSTMKLSDVFPVDDPDHQHDNGQSMPVTQRASHGKTITQCPVPRKHDCFTESLGEGAGLFNNLHNGSPFPLLRLSSFRCP